MDAASGWTLGKKGAQPLAASFGFLPVPPYAGNCDFPAQIGQAMDVNKSMSRFCLLIKISPAAGLTEMSKPRLDFVVALRPGARWLSVGWNPCDYPWRSCQLSSI